MTVCVTGVAGVLHLFAVVISFGFFEYHSASLMTNCFFQGLLGLTGAGLYYTGAVVRVREFCVKYTGKYVAYGGVYGVISERFA